MIARNGAIALAAGIVLLAAESSRAEFRTTSLTLPTGGLDGGAYNMTLEGAGQNDADNVDVWGWRRWGGYGYRGGWGWRGGYGWGGYRGYYGGWGGYRSYYGWGGGYRPYWGGYSYYPSYYSFYRPYYYYPSYYYYTPFCSLTTDAISPAQETQSNFATTPQAAPAQQPFNPYDGGPSNPVPMPIPKAQPAPATPSLAVSLPAKAKTRFAYPAYGERTEPTGFAVDRR